MKICWDNLEKIYLTKKGNLKHGSSILYEKICANCKIEFLGGKDQNCCSLKCANSGKFHPNYNKITSKEVIEKIKNSISKEKHYNWKGGISSTKLSWYDTYASKISWIEEVRRAPDNENILEVRCKYCGKWFKPLHYQVSHRKSALDRVGAESYFYCSEECK